jgi:hypothetical protein
MLTEIGGEPNAMGGEAIQIGGFDNRMTVTADIAVEIVRHDEKDIEGMVLRFKIMCGNRKSKK